MAESLHILLGTSACLQWLCHSGERTVARGPLVLFFPENRILHFMQIVSIGGNSHEMLKSILLSAENFTQCICRFGRKVCMLFLLY